QIAGTNFLCAFADQDGVVLDTIMDHDFASSDCARSIQPGSVWREDLRGTNALGLALQTGQASMVTGGEHFFACHGRVSCVSVPIFASDGRIAGLLDASSEVAERQAHTGALVSLAATNIENRLFAEAHSADLILEFHPRKEYLPTQSVALLAFDQAGRVRGANRASDRMLVWDGAADAAFQDLFREDLSQLLTPLYRGETVQISDQLGAGYFARLRPDMAMRRLVQIGTPKDPKPAPQSAKSSGQALVWDDDMARNAWRLAERAGVLGQSLCIRGAAGTGKTAMAMELHRGLHGAQPVIAFDCRAVGKLPKSLPDLALEGGSLILENASGMSALDAYQLAIPQELVEQCDLRPGWTVIATQDLSETSRDAQRDSFARFAGVEMLVIDLPELHRRTDRAKLAQRILAGLSPDHQLSKKALDLITELEWSDNLHGLRRLLKLLASHCPKGVLRDTQIARFLPERSPSERACPRCDPSPIRRQRCLDIRRAYRSCQNNVALTARHLGVSRNTVYAHLKD
ncbi:MAG: sigma-54-dependent Fis family transcriptional regulator, partial [Mangrovicoccus sp.]